MLEEKEKISDCVYNQNIVNYNAWWGSQNMQLDTQVDILLDFVLASEFKRQLDGLLFKELT